MKRFGALDAIKVSVVVFWKNKYPFLLIVCTSILAIGQIESLVENNFGEIPSLPSLLGIGTTQDENPIDSPIILLELFVTISLLKSTLSYGTFCSLSGEDVKYSDLRGRIDSLRFWRYVVQILMISGIYAFTPLVIYVPLFVVGIALMSIHPEGGIVYLLLAVLLSNIFILFFAGRYYIAIPVAVNEGSGLLESFSRSSELSKGNRWGVLRVVALIYIPVAAIYGLYASIVSTSEGAATIPSIVYFALTGVFAALDGIVSTVCYFYFRYKKYDMGSRAES